MLLQLSQDNTVHSLFWVRLTLDKSECYEVTNNLWGDEKQGQPPPTVKLLLISFLYHVSQQHATLSLNVMIWENTSSQGEQFKSIVGEVP